MSNFGIENNGTSTFGMLNLGVVSGTLNSGTDDNNDTLNFGGEGTSVLGMLSFGIEKEGMSGTYILGSDAAGDNGAPSKMPHPRPHPCPLAGLAPSLPSPSPAASRMRTSRRRHSCHGKDTIATTTIDRHCRTTAIASKDNNSHFNAAFAVAVDITAATAVATAITITFTAAIAAVLALSAAITVVVVAATAAAAAAAATVTTAPSPLPLLSLSLQPPPTSPHLRRSYQWLVVVSSVPHHLMRRPPSKFVSPPCHVVVDVNDNRYRHRQQLLSPLPQSTTTTAKNQRLLFVTDGGNDDYH
jgi:hypothetical protein